MDIDASGVVDHKEFVLATPKQMPHGFKQYSDAKNDNGAGQSMEGKLDMASLMADEPDQDAELDELMEEEDLIHEKVLDLESKLGNVGGDISTIKKNMEKLMEKLGIKAEDAEEDM